MPLYVEEAFSDKISALLERRREPALFNELHELEFENAVRLKVFRREFDQNTLTRILNDVNADIQGGRLLRRPVRWPQAFDVARRLSQTTTTHHGCRSLDLLHVAIAVHWNCREFVSADDHQLKAADEAGLGPVDLRTVCDAT